MRVLVAIPYFPPAFAFGGSVTVAGTIVEDLVALGHTVTVITTDVFDEHRRIRPQDPAFGPAAAVLRFPNVSHRAAARANVYLPRGFRSWVRAHAAEHDIVLLQDIYSAVSVHAARAAAAANVPYVVQPLGTLAPTPERGKPLAKRAFLRAWGHRTLRQATAHFCITEHEHQEHLAVGVPAEKIIKMPLPLDLPDASGDARADAPTVAYVGRLHPIKRIDLLIEAMAVVRREIPNARLEIVGPGDRHQAQLHALATRLGLDEAVCFHGYVATDKKIEILHRAHVSALLSAGEGLPMAALEAMACGTPVVLSQECHFPEVHGRGGLVTAAAPEAAATSLARLLDDQGLRAELSNGARELAARFRREAVMPQMADVLAEVAGRRLVASA